MIARFLLLILLIPFVELMAFRRVYVWLKGFYGAQMAVEMIILAVIVLAVVGVKIIKRQGARFMQGMRSGTSPAGQALDGAVLIVSGLLLLIPGFVTDVLAFLILLPGIRPFIARRAQAAFIKRFMKAGGGFQIFQGNFGGFGAGPFGGMQRPPSMGQHKRLDDGVIDVEARESPL